MFDKVQKPSDSSSDWSPNHFQKQDNSAAWSPQPQKQKPSSFSTSTNKEDTWSLDDDPLLSRWKREEASNETQPDTQLAQPEQAVLSIQQKSDVEQLGEKDKNGINHPTSEMMTVAAPATTVADGRSAGYKPGIEYLLRQGGSRNYDTIINMTKNASQEERRSVSQDPNMRQLIVKHLSPPEATTVMAAVLQGEQHWETTPGSEFSRHFLHSDEFMGYDGKMNCWEMILYTAYLLGQISYKQLRKFVDTTYGGFFGFNESGIWERLGWSKYIRYCYKGRGIQGKEEIAPKPGDLLFFHNNEGTKVRELPGHVAISLGDENAISLFTQPNNYDRIQRINVKNIYPNEGYVLVGEPITKVVNETKKEEWN